MDFFYQALSWLMASEVRAEPKSLSTIIALIVLVGDWLSRRDNHAHLRLSDSGAYLLSKRRRS
jgi:hypothetical protein